MESKPPGKKQFEARMIQLLRRRFEDARLKVEDHLKIGELPLEIDLLVNIEHDKAEEADSLPSLFHYFQRHNVIELKTEADTLEIGDLVKLQAYVWHYMFKAGIYTIADVTAAAIVHHLTAPVLEALPALGYEPFSKGVFKRKSDLASFLISLEDVPDELVPEELQIFSNAKRRKQIFLTCFDDPNKRPLLDAITDLYEKEVIALMTPLNIREESMPKFIEALGRERVIAALNKKELIAALSKEELMAALSEDDLLAAVQGKEQLLKTLLANLEPEKLRKLIAEVGRG